MSERRLVLFTGVEGSGKKGGGCGFMIRVEARAGEPLDKTLRRFKKQCEKEGLTKEMKRSAYFEKPSARRRRRIRSTRRD